MRRILANPAFRPPARVNKSIPFQKTKGGAWRPAFRTLIRENHTWLDAQNIHLARLRGQWCILKMRM